MSPGTEFARDFCAGIGPLQLGVVLVLIVFNLSVVVVVSSNYMYVSYVSRQAGIYYFISALYRRAWRGEGALRPNDSLSAPVRSYTLLN